MKRALIALLFAGATAFTVSADTSSMAGKWNLHYNISGYEGDLDCTLTQTGADIKGTCKAEQGNVDITGKVDDKSVTLQYKTQYNGDDLTAVYTGKFESVSKVTGTVNVQPMGVDGDFTATAK